MGQVMWPRDHKRPKKKRILGKVCDKSQGCRIANQSDWFGSNSRA